MSGQFLLTDSQQQWPATLTASANSEKGDPERGEVSKIPLDRYENCRSGVPSVASLGEIVEEIRNPGSRFCDLIGAIRRCYRSNGGGKCGKDAIRELKTQLPAVVFNARGSREQAELSNGIVAVDMDELGGQLGVARSRLEDDPHCLLVFISPSGDGLKAIFKVPASAGGDRELRHQHRKNFHAVRRYLKERWLLDVDLSGSDLMRLCFLSHDPECSLSPAVIDLQVEKYFSDEADPDDLSDDPNAGEHGADNQERVDPEIVQAHLNGIPPRPDYTTWLKIAAAVRNSVGDTATAIKILKNWSQEERPGEYRKLLDACKFSRIGFGTLHYHARRHGFSGVLKKCFYAGKSGYYFETGGKIVPLAGADLRKHLEPYRIGRDALDDFLCRVRAENLVDYVGDVAGRASGIHRFQGNQILIKRGPTLIQSRRGGTGFINNFIRVLLGGEEQYGAFMSWLQIARRSVVLGQRRQLPAMVLAGEIGNGKSFTIDVVRQSLGGRMANAHNFLAGISRFNADLAGAELLYLDDSAAAKDHTTRCKFAQQIKAHLFASSVAIEGKGETPIELDPVQALIIAVNSEPHHLRVLPEIDDSMEDKIILLKTNVSPLPVEVVGDREKVQSKILEDLPGWLDIVESYDAKKYINNKNGRLICIKSPELLQLLEVVSLEGNLLELLDRSFLRNVNNWTGTAAQVEEILTCNSAQNSLAAKRLLSWPGACGTYLSKLASRKDGIVAKGPLTKKTRIQQYIINLSKNEIIEESEESEESV